VTRAVAVVLLALLVLLVWAGMLAGWRRRAARQTRELGLTALPPMPVEPGGAGSSDQPGTAA
jgi:hypothetical protein